MYSWLREFMKDEIEEERIKAKLEVKKSMAVSLKAQGVDISIIADAARIEISVVEEWLKSVDEHITLTGKS